MKAKKWLDVFSNVSIGGLIAIAFITVVALLSMFVWNIGVVGWLATNATELGFSSAFALITGMVLLHLLVLHWVNKIKELMTLRMVLKQLEAQVTKNNGGTS